MDLNVRIRMFETRPMILFAFDCLSVVFSKVRRASPERSWACAFYWQPTRGLSLINIDSIPCHASRNGERCFRFLCSGSRILLSFRFTVLTGPSGGFQQKVCSFFLLRPSGPQNLVSFAFSTVLVRIPREGERRN